MRCRAAGWSGLFSLIGHGRASWHPRGFSADLAGGKPHGTVEGRGAGNPREARQLRVTVHHAPQAALDVLMNETRRLSCLPQGRCSCC